MYDFLLVVQTIIVLMLIGIILIQRSDSDGFGTGTGGGGNQFMTGRGSANLLTRTTAILATAFIILSLILAKISSGTGGSSITDLVEKAPAETSTSAPLVDAEEAPAKPAKPASVPKPE